MEWTKYMRPTESLRRFHQKETRTLVALCQVDDSCSMLRYAVDGCDSECVFIRKVWHLTFARSKYENPKSFFEEWWICSCKFWTCGYAYRCFFVVPSLVGEAARWKFCFTDLSGRMLGKNDANFDIKLWTICQSHFPYHPCMEHLIFTYIWLIFFGKKRIQINHTWILWVLECAARPIQLFATLSKPIIQLSPLDSVLLASKIQSFERARAPSWNTHRAIIGQLCHLKFERGRLTCFNCTTSLLRVQ